MYLLEKVKRFLSYRDAISFYKPIFSYGGGKYGFKSTF